MISRTRKNCKARFLQSNAVHKFLSVFRSINIYKVAFKFSADYDYFAFFFSGNFFYSFNIFICAFCNRIFINIADKKLRFYCKKMKIINSFKLIICQICLTCAFSFLQQRQNFIYGTAIAGKFFFFRLSHCANLTCNLVFAFCNCVYIRLTKFIVNSKNIALRINRSVSFCIFANMLNIRIVKTADNMRNYRSFADICKELVSKTFTI